MIRNTKPWHSECVRLRADGLSIEALAAHFGKTRRDIRWVLDIDGERAKAAARVMKSRNGETYRVRPGYLGKPKADEPPKRDRRLVLAPPDVRMAAARAFAAGEIDRAELMRRISA